VPGTEDNPVIPPAVPPERGPAGETGAVGATGPAGVSRRVKFFAGLFLALVVVMSGGTLISQQLQQNQFESTITTNHNANLQRQAAQGAAIEAKLCKTLKPLEPLAELKAPPGDPAANPSRAFEQQLVIRLAPLAQLGADIGCRP
jgi:hypothetical protein